MQRTLLVLFAVSLCVVFMTPIEGARRKSHHSEQAAGSAPAAARNPARSASAANHASQRAEGASMAAPKASNRGRKGGVAQRAPRDKEPAAAVGRHAPSQRLGAPGHGGQISARKGTDARRVAHPQRHGAGKQARNIAANGHAARRHYPANFKFPRPAAH